MGDVEVFDIEDLVYGINEEYGVTFGEVESGMDEDGGGCEGMWEEEEHIDGQLQEET